MHDRCRFCAGRTDVRQLLSFVVTVVFLLQAPSAHAFQFQRRLIPDVANTPKTPTPHPLIWWTRNPLRLDEGDYPLLKANPDDGHIITPRDYRIEQKVTTLGVVSGHRIIEVITTFHAGPHLIFNGFPLADSPPTQWKSLLVEVGTGDSYVEIYRLQADGGLYEPIQSAAVMGVGDGAILRTFDPTSGNGGHCSEGYWWFNKSGAHDVDFSQLDRAIASAQPPATTAWPHCWALASNNYEVRVGVQRTDAKCHACDWLGEIVATYQIKQGQATPTSIHFVPTPEQ
jgi:hypothetical protein